jgi:hypothetical protein
VYPFFHRYWACLSFIVYSKNLCSTLPRFKAGIRFADDVQSPTTPDDLAIRVTVFQGLD